MKTGIRLFELVLVVVLAGSLLGACQHYSEDERPEKMIGRMEKQIDRALTMVEASPEQRSQIALITSRIRYDALLSYHKYSENRGSMIVELLSDNPDLEALHQQVDKRTLAMAEFSHRLLNRFVEISGVLSPDQRAKLKAQIKKTYDPEE